MKLEVVSVSNNYYSCATAYANYASFAILIRTDAVQCTTKSIIIEGNFVATYNFVFLTMRKVFLMMVHFPIVQL